MHQVIYKALFTAVFLTSLVLFVYMRRDAAEPSAASAETVAASPGPSEAAACVSLLLRRGMSALTIPINQSRPLESPLRPGDRVDLVHTGVEAPSLLQNVLVLAIIEDTGDGTRPNSVSLSMTLQQATVLTHALTSGDIELILRHHCSYGEPENLSDIDSADLIAPIIQTVP